MDTTLPADVVAFGAAARDRFAALGGAGLALRAETDDSARDAASDALDELGAWDVDLRAGADEFLAAAELCRAAGAVVLPYPLVEGLLSIESPRMAITSITRSGGTPRISSTLAASQIKLSFGGFRMCTLPFTNCIMSLSLETM